MMTTSEVPMACLMSRMGGLSKKTMAGTMMMPPPTPNKPLATPLTSPIIEAIRICMAA